MVSARFFCPTELGFAEIVNSHAKIVGVIEDRVGNGGLGELEVSHENEVAGCFHQRAISLIRKMGLIF